MDVALIQVLEQGTAPQIADTDIVGEAHQSIEHSLNDLNLYEVIHALFDLPKITAKHFLSLRLGDDHAGPDTPGGAIADGPGSPPAAWIRVGSKPEPLKRFDEIDPGFAGCIGHALFGISNRLQAVYPNGVRRHG